MPISASEILYKLSVPSASSGNSAAQGDVNASLGKYISTTQITTAVVNNLFDNISGAENAASGVDYRAFFVHNSNTSGTLYSAVIWISGQVAGGASIEIGLDPSGNTPVGQINNQATFITTETGVPAGVTFSNPTSQGTALSIGDLSANYCRGVWVKRSAANTAAVNNDGATLQTAGDTGA